MADCEIGEFVAIMQDLIDKFTSVLKANKEIKRKSGLHFCFLFQN